MAYEDFKDLARRTASDRLLRDKAFDIAKNLKYDGYQRGLASMVYKVFDKKSASDSVFDIKRNQQLAEELHKSIIKQFTKKRRVYSSFKENLWGVALADMQLISKLNNGIMFLLYVIDVFGKYAWVISIKDKKV